MAKKANFGEKIGHAEWFWRARRLLQDNSKHGPVLRLAVGDALEYEVRGLLKMVPHQRNRSIDIACQCSIHDFLVLFVDVALGTRKRCRQASESLGMIKQLRTL